MNHEDTEKKIFELYDRELPPAEKAEIEEHITSCSACREIYEGWKRTSSVFFPSSEVMPSEEFVRKVMTRVEREGNQRIMTFPSMRDFLEKFRMAFSLPRLVLGGAAAFVGAFLLIFFLVNSQRFESKKTESFQQVRYLEVLLGEPLSDPSDDAEEYGTAIEQYFL